MQDSALILLAGVLVCFLTIVSVFANLPILFCFLFCVIGTGLIGLSMYGLCNHN